ncbi:hypothetical protein CR513_01464, partial [Mucuna pruriens]
MYIPLNNRIPRYAPVNHQDINPTPTRHSLRISYNFWKKDRELLRELVIDLCLVSNVVMHKLKLTEFLINIREALAQRTISPCIIER